MWFDWHRGCQVTGALVFCAILFVAIILAVTASCIAPRDFIYIPITDSSLIRGTSCQHTCFVFTLKSCRRQHLD